MTRSLPTPRNTEAKLDHILRHAAEIFANHGFEGTSIRDISRATGSHSRDSTTTSTVNNASSISFKKIHLRS